MLISEVFDEFVQYKLIEEERSPETIVKYHDCIHRFIELEGDLDVEAIGKFHITDIKVRLQHLSAARISSILNCVRSLLKYCEDEKELEVYDHKKIKVPRIPDKEIIYLTNEEIKAFLDEIDITTLTGLRTRTLCEVLLDTGARISEALQLDRTSILTEDRVTFAKIIGKGKKERKLYFSGRALFWIEKYLNAREDSESPLFVTHKKGFTCERLRRNHGTKDLAIIAKRAGIQKKITPHIFRHTFLTNLIKNGCSLAVLQRLAGHARIQTTIKFYARLDDTDLIAGKQKLDYEVVDNWQEEKKEKCWNLGIKTPTQKQNLSLSLMPA